MTPLLMLAIVLMLGGALLLVTGTGAAGLWIGVIAVGIAMVAIERSRHGHHQPRP